MLALGVMPMVGCSDTQPECRSGKDCGDECNSGHCFSSTGACDRGSAVWRANGTSCDWDGVAGVCVSGVCGENLCEGVVCDDGNECTDDACDYVDGMCVLTPVDCADDSWCTEDTCEPANGSCDHTAKPNGTICFLGYCSDGVCILSISFDWSQRDFATP